MGIMANGRLTKRGRAIRHCSSDDGITPWDQKQIEEIVRSVIGVMGIADVPAARRASRNAVKAQSRSRADGDRKLRAGFRFRRVREKPGMASRTHIVRTC